MQLGIPAEMLTELLSVLFPPRLARSTSNYPHTAKAVGRFRATGRGFRDQK
eukprot:gene27260-41879_t